MPIPLERLRTVASQKREVLAKSLTEARAAGLKTAFLCHSHLDRDLVMGMESLLQAAGWNVYIDWRDGSMPTSSSRETASKIKDRIKAAVYFLFLATPNSVVSRWCPWEIGYADGVKPIDNLFVIPTSDRDGNHYGNEYLQLYRQIDFSKADELAAWMPGQDTGGVRVRAL